MKDQILKIAKVKSEKEFYKKYPSEEAFMKAHGKAFKKAAMGSKMVNDQLHQLTDFGNPPIAQLGGAVNPNTGMFQMPMSGKSVSQFDTMAAGYGSTPPPEGFGNVKASGGGGGFDAAGAGMAGLQGIGKVIGGIEAIAAQRKAQKKAQQSAQLGELALTAQQTMEKPKNQYVRPEDSLVQPGQLGNPYGTGTNYLQAQNGTMIDGLKNYAKINYPESIKKIEEILKRVDVMGERGSLNPELPMHSDTLYPGNKYKDAFMKTPNIRTEKDESFKKGRPLTNEQKAIVLHHTGYTDTARDNDVSWAMRGVDKLFRTPGAESSHVVIDFNGNRYNYANPNQVAFHAGKSMMNDRDNVNDFGVGVEFQGDTDQTPLTKEQLESFMEYAAPIMKKNKIPIDNVVTHKQIRKNYIDKNPNDKKAAAESKPDVNDKEYSKIIQALKKKGAFQMGGALSGATGMIGGNPTEIQNTYTPGDLYSDLGYEPLEESYKQYRHGGEMPKAEFGEYFQDSGQAQIGSAVGGAVAQGFGLPPAVGELVGKVAGNLLGGAKDARKLQAQKDKAALNQSMMGFEQTRAQGPLSANLEHGGWVSHDWQPQVFAKFGEYDAKDLLKPPHDADMLRSGGHLAQVGYTAPSAEALYTGRPDMPNAQNGVQMAMGGDLEIGEGGRLETLSYNPNLPGGEIGMFRGASHDNGGIKTKYGENEVEVEGNEPVVKLKDGGSSENLVVFGNIKINKEIADLMGDPKAKGKKFKTYIADVAKNDAKQLKKINKGLELIEGANENSAFDHLTLNTGKVMLQGAKAWQKINADKIKEAGLVQDSIHQTANELGVKSDKLAEGKLEKETDPSMIGKNGKKMKKAQLGSEIDPTVLEQIKRGIAVSPGLPGSTEAAILPEAVVSSSKKPKIDYSLLEWPDLPGPFTKDEPMAEATGDKKKFDWKKLGDIGKAALSYAEPWLRPSNANEDLNPDQLYPEYYALAMNQLDPVKSQQFQPMLDTPYDISFNDQINAIDAQSRAFLRATGNNPAAQAAVMAQTIEAKNKLFGESNRMNQANKMAVYDKNRAAINDAKLKNLAINDQQYVRQSEAISKTKAQNIEALKSISDKVAKQRAANRKLAVMENMYNFRFSPSGRAISFNSPAQFDTSGMNARRSGLSSAGLPTNKRFTIDSVTGEPVGIRTLTKDEMAGNTPSLSEIDSYLDTQKKGGKTPKTKARNSSIVKALKSL